MRQHQMRSMLRCCWLALMWGIRPAKICCSYPPQRFSLGDLPKVRVPREMASETNTVCIWDGVLLVCFMAELFQRSHSRRLNISLLCVQWSVRSTVAHVHERISTCVHSTACTYWSHVRLWLAVTRALYIISVNFVGCCFVDSWLCQIW